MFKLLNLAEVNCTALSIITHIKLSPEIADKVLNDSFVVKRGKVPFQAIYGLIYMVDDKPHAIRARIRRIRKKYYHLEFEYMQEKWPKPPKVYKSPEILANTIAQESQKAVIVCNAYFVYDKNGGWESTIDVPIPLEKQEGEEELFTHIEAYKLSRREQNEIKYSIKIERNKNGDIEHSVCIRDLLKGTLSENVAENLLERSVKISKAFLTREGE